VKGVGSNQSVYHFMKLDIANYIATACNSDGNMYS